MGFNQKLVLIFVSTFVILFVIELQGSPFPEDNSALNPEEKYDCKKVMTKIMKKLIKTFGGCTKEVKANSTKEDFDKKMGCIVRCVMNKAGLMDNSSMVTKESVQGFMNSMNIPEEAHDLGHFLSEDCINDHSAKLDPSQPFCESYGEFTMCMQNVLGDFAEKFNCAPGLMG